MPDSSELEDLRTQIDSLNEELVSLLNKRAELAKQVGSAKQDSPAYAPGREAKIFQELKRFNKGPLSQTALRAIFIEIIAACRNLQQPTIVAYLGPPGTYSEEAARKQLGGASTYKSYASFDEVIGAVEKGEATLAVLPVENSTEGPVNRTLDLLLKTSLSIVGEITLPIHHQLLTQAKSLSEVHEIVAHPQALAQCRLWLQQKLPDVTQRPMSSNAEAALYVSIHTSSAAIASQQASQTYNLPILATSIEDESSNATRFLVLGNKGAQPTGADKTSLICSVTNRPGALNRLLDVFDRVHINMTKLESRPITNQPWHYMFYIDVEGHTSDIILRQAVTDLREVALTVKVLGSYPKAV